MMLTPTLAHEQADFLRVIASGRIVKICNQGHVEGEDQPSDEFIESLDGLIECVWDCVDHGESPDLTDAGREALAAYDAANVTISREDLRRLSDVLEDVMTLRPHPAFGFDHDRALARWKEDTAILERLRAALEAK